MDIDNNFKKIQQDYFKHADVQRFNWRTKNSYVSRKEQELLLPMLKTGAQTILEVGCGEAANLVNIKKICHYRCDLFGVDYSPEKVAFVQKLGIGNVSFADAVNLPFESGKFDLTFAKDLFHHLTHDQQRMAIREMIRVCRKGGQIVLIEGNGRFNPFIFLFSLLIKGERGGIKMSKSKALEIMTQSNDIGMVVIRMLEPSSFFRVLLHYKWGLGRFGWTLRPIIGAIDRAVSWITAEKCYGYIFASTTKTK